MEQDSVSLFKGSYTPISSDILYDSFFFSTISKPDLKGEANPSQDSVYTYNSKVPLYLNGFAVRFEFYENSTWDKCLFSFVAGSILPVASVSDSKKTASENCRWKPDGCDKFVFEHRNVGLLMPSKNKELSHTVDLVLRISMKEDTEEGTQFYIEFFSLPEDKTLREGYMTFTIPSNSSLVKFHKNLIQLGSSRSKTGYSDEIAKIMGREITKVYECVNLVQFWSHLAHVTSFISRIGLILFENIYRKQKSQWEDKALSSKKSSLHENILGLDRLITNFSAMEKNFRLCEDKLDWRESQDMLRESERFKIKVTEIGNNNARSGWDFKKYKVCLIDPYRFNRKITEDFGTGLKECGTFIIFEHRIYSEKQHVSDDF